MMIQAEQLTELAEKCNYLSRLLWEGKEKQDLPAWKWLVSSTATEIVNQIEESGIKDLGND